VKIVFVDYIIISEGVYTKPLTPLIRGFKMPKITQKLLTEEMIPIANMNDKEFQKLKIIVDGHDAECYIAERFGSSKVVILFEKEHPEWGGTFTTKNFSFTKAGTMSWGHMQETMYITTVLSKTDL
jgi:hypothetical protein